MDCPPRGKGSIENVSIGDPSCNAMHMLSSALYFEINCRTGWHYCGYTPHDTTHSAGSPNTSLVFTRVMLRWNYKQLGRTLRKKEALYSFPNSRGIGNEPVVLAHGNSIPLESSRL